MWEGGNRARKTPRAARFSLSLAGKQGSSSRLSCSRVWELGFFFLSVFFHASRSIALLSVLSYLRHGNDVASEGCFVCQSETVSRGIPDSETVGNLLTGYSRV